MNQQAIVMGWPKEKVRTTLPIFKDNPKQAKVTLPAHDKPFSYQMENQELTFELPEISAEQRKCGYAWVLEWRGLW